MNKIITIGQWKYFVLSYLVIATSLMLYFISDKSSIFIIWAIVLIVLICVVIILRNPIIKIEEENIKLVYLFKEKIIPRKNIIKINSFAFFSGAYILVTKKEEFFLLLNPFMTFMNSWVSTRSYSEKITSILKGDVNS